MHLQFLNVERRSERRNKFTPLFYAVLKSNWFDTKVHNQELIL